MVKRKLEQDWVIAAIRTIKWVDNWKEKDLYSLTIMDREKKYIVDCTWHDFEQQKQYAIWVMAWYKKWYDKGYDEWKARWYDEGYSDWCDKYYDEYSIS